MLLRHLLLLHALFFTAALAGRHQRRLLQQLFGPADRTNPMEAVYNVMERPVKNESDVLLVWFEASLQQITDLDEKEQILSTSFWLDMTWHDYNLMWDPVDFGGITKITVAPTHVWRPDIFLYNSADGRFDGTFPTNVVIEHTGNVNFIPPGSFRSTCRIDITWFPFDTQECNLKFGSWSFDGGEVDLRLKCLNSSLNTTEKRLNDPLNCSELGEADMATFLTNSEWNLESAVAKRTALTYDCCPYPFVYLQYFIKMRRRTPYFVVNLVIPCVLISSMALLTFVLPPDSGQKISLGVTILLSLTLFQVLVASAMPPTSEAIPLIGLYFFCTMAMCSLSLVFTVLVLNYHHRNSKSHPGPNLVRKFICTHLARILRMKRNNEGKKIVHDTALPAISVDAAVADQNKMAAASVHDVPSADIATSATNQPSLGVGDLKDANHLLGSSSIDLQASVVRELRVITKKISDDIADREVSSEWKFAARVIDRLCLIMFSSFIFITTIAIFFSAPNAFKG